MAYKFVTKTSSKVVFQHIDYCGQYCKIWTKIIEPCIVKNNLEELIGCSRENFKELYITNNSAIDFFNIMYN